MDTDLVEDAEYFSGSLGQEESDGLLLSGQHIVVHYQTLLVGCGGGGGGALVRYWEMVR